MGGGHTFYLSKEQASRYKIDPASVIAEILQCDLAVYETWLHWNGRVQCSGKTGKGHRCKGTVPRVVYYTPSEYAKDGGGYCVTHGG